MVSFDRTKTYELVGLYIQSELQKILPKSNFRLYRDDGLDLLRNLNGQQTDKVSKDIITIFKDIAFSLEIETNLKETNFLDGLFNLSNRTYRPYKKPNNRLFYIHSLLNHPPNVIKQIPNSIQDILSKNSSKEQIFNTTPKREYENILKKSEFKVNFKYTKNQSQKPKNRTRNFIWFNPPFNKVISTIVSNLFIRLINRHFPNSHRHKFTYIKFTETRRWLVTAVCKICPKFTMGIIARLHLHRVTKRCRTLAKVFFLLFFLIYILF